MIRGIYLSPKEVDVVVSKPHSRLKRISEATDHNDGIFSYTFRDIKMLEDRLVQELGAELQGEIPELKAKGANAIILDFTGVKYWNSAVLGKLLSFRRRAEIEGAKLYLCYLSPEMLDTFKIAQMDKDCCLDFRKDLGSAIEAARLKEHKPQINYKEQ